MHVYEPHPAFRLAFVACSPSLIHEEKAEKKNATAVDAPVGAIVFGKGVSDAVRMKVLVAVVASKQSPAMVDGGSISEPSVKTANGLVSGTNAVCR